jgi:hypothetical protein
MYEKIRLAIRRFKHWFKFQPPGSMTSKGWRLFNAEFKEKAPIRYWFGKKFRRSFILPIIWRYKDIIYWIRYRTTDKYNILDTGLKPGYYEIETLMLNVNFNMLKNFVEVEQAIHTYWWSDEYKNAGWCEKHVPFYYRFYPFRRPDLGIKHLEWSATLDDPALPPHERCVSQAIFARETLALYKWWVEERPARAKEEYTSYDNQGFGSMGCLDDDFDRDAPDYKAHVESMNRRAKQEEDWLQEDEDMLIRLVKIRTGLWT